MIPAAPVPHDAVVNTLVLAHLACAALARTSRSSPRLRPGSDRHPGA